MEIYEQIYIQKLETSTVKDRYLLIYNGLYYEASAPVVETSPLICRRKKNMDEAITSYIKKKNRIFSYTEIEEINVPDHALLYLKDYTRGAEERPFTYVDGKQIWW